eukprot:791396-Rhodomonas_salina.1
MPTPAVLALYQALEESVPGTLLSSMAHTVTPEEAATIFERGDLGAQGQGQEEVRDDLFLDDISEPGSRHEESSEEDGEEAETEDPIDAFLLGLMGDAEGERACSPTHDKIS